MYVTIAFSALLMSVSCAQFQKPNDPMLNNVMKMTPKDDPDTTIQNQASGSLIQKPESHIEPQR